MTYSDMLLNLIVYIGFSIAAYIFSVFLHNIIVQLLFKHHDKLLLYRFDIRNDLFKLIICGFIICGVILALDQTVFDRFLKCSIVVVFVFLHFISTPDKNDLLEKNELDIGYGAALWYYFNYLYEIELHSSFVKRVKIFESKNDVEVLQKLFLLVPDSCIVPETIEDEKDRIERCRELEPFQKTNAGIKSRVYNHTLYLVRKSIRNGDELRMRMVLEYAQPCKGLYALKSKNIINEEEMARQRKIFVSSLQEFLHDKNDSYKYCEIIVFNDKIQKVYDALIQHCCF